MQASIVEAPGKSHGSINQEIGSVYDHVMRAVVEFLSERLGSHHDLGADER